MSSRSLVKLILNLNITLNIIRPYNLIDRFFWIDFNPYVVGMSFMA